MKLEFGSISTSPKEFFTQERSWLPEEEGFLVKNQHARITVTRTSEKSVLLNGDMSFEIEFLCDRCGEPYTAEIGSEFTYIVKDEEDETLQSHEKECTEEDIITLYLQEPILNLNDILREQFFLSIPDSRVCKKSCKGLCRLCGTPMTKSECNCGSVSADSPFAVLAKLKK